MIRKLALLSAALILVHCSSAIAQTGIPPFSSTTGGPDVINLGNLNVHFAVPIVHKPGRGIPFDYVMSYDSSIWSPVTSGSSKAWQPVLNWGWRGETEASIGYVPVATFQIPCIHPLQPPTYETVYLALGFNDSFGVLHMAPAQVNTSGGAGCSEVDTATAKAKDGSGYTLTLSLPGPRATVTSAEGAVTDPPIQTTGSGNVTDRNGNQLTTTGTSFTDTLGFTALSISGGAPNPLSFQYHDTGGNPQNVVMNYGSYTVRTNFNCSGVSQYGPTTVSLVSSISFPDGSSDHFTYESTPGFPGDVTGRVASIQLRTGGTISYAYTGSNGIVCADGSTDGLTRTTPDGQWSYSRVNPSGTAWTTTMQSPPGDKTVINFQNSGNFYETLRQVYQGLSTLLETVYSCYNATAPDCSAQAITLPITEKAVYTNLNGPENKVDTFYNGSFTGSGLPSEVDEYDFGSSAPGPLLRKTTLSYASLGNGIVDQVSNVTVQEGGVQKALTNYYYDQTGLGNPTGAPQHVGVNGSRGNLTESSQWLNTNGTYLNTLLGYDDTGNVVSSTDPRGNITGLQYSNSFAYVSQVTLPPTGNGGAVAHTLQATYDSNTGLVTTSTDQNSQITRYYYDSMLRPSSIQYPDGGNTSFTYATPNSIETKRAIDGTRVIDQTTNLDSLGRQGQTVLVDPEGNDTSETSYDGDGRVFTVTNPHRGVGSATDGTTTYAYDALNRITKVTKPDGAFAQTNFIGNTVTNIDEANHPRETVFDGIGRLTNVIEPNPANGSLSTGNYSTTFAYTALSTTITQPGDGSQGARVRTFNFDSLSRTTSEMVPESGTTIYGYDADSNLTSVTDARNITTTIGYEALNRPTIKTYSNGETSREFMYDQANHGSSIGRLTHASNDVNSAYDPSYDLMGRVTSESYCIPSECNYTKQTVATYDLAGDMISLTYPDGRKIVNTFSTRGALTNVNYDSFAGTGVNYPYYTVPQGSPSTPSTWGYWPAGGLQQFSFGPGVSENLSANSRLVMNQITASAASQTVVSKTYGFANAVPSNNNGNILSIADNLNSGRTQNFGYDFLNRLTSALTVATTGPDAWSQNFTIDPWGNMKQSGSYGFSPNFDTSNRIATGQGYTYDSAGNLTAAPAPGAHTFTYDAESRMKTVDSTAATYTYGPDGERARKDFSDGTWNEYVYLGGQVVAEKSSAGDWTDYIFANGQRVAKAEALDDRLHIYGTKDVSTQWVVEYFANAAGLVNYTIRSGDKLFLTQYQNTGSKGGMVLNFTNGSNSSWSVKDKEGYYLNDDHTQAVSHFRTIDLSSLAGKIISKVGLDQETDTVIGTWGIMYEQISLVSTDGTVYPIYTGQTTTPINSVAQSGGETGIGSQIDVNRSLATSPTLTTTYYVADHLGTSRLLMSGNGYPIWSGVFLPYGQEWNPQITMNHYKFTGDEHDSESNLEHTWFRQYEATQGRWLSPDPAGMAAVDPTDPQTLNRYAYAGNKPMNAFDPLGLWVWGFGGCFFDTVEVETGTPEGGSEFQGFDTNFLGCFPGGERSLGPPEPIDLQDAGGGGGGGGTGSTATLKGPPKVDCSRVPPQPPTPPGASVDANVQHLRNVMDAMGDQNKASLPASIEFLNDVRPFGVWDYKNNSGLQYTSFGNFNFGASCSVLGMTLQDCQRGAGAAAYATAFNSVIKGKSWTAGPGNPLQGGQPGVDGGMPVYGDQATPLENQSVIAGFGYEQWKQQCQK